MKRTEELFSLIHTLDKAEKRFFKLSASIEGGEKQYMRIFDIVARQSEYDEKEILSELRISKNLLAFQKNYLQRLILNHIAFLHSTRRNNAQFLLTQAEILKNKGLYPQLSKLLQKLKEQARESDMNHVLFEAAGMEHGLAWKDQRLDDAAAAISDKMKIVELLKIETEYHALANEVISTMVRLGDEKKPEMVRVLKKMVKHPLISNEKNAVSFRCKNYLYHMLSLYYSVAGDVQKQYVYAKKNAQLFLEPNRIKNFTMTHVFALHNLVGACNAVRKYDEAQQNLDILLKSSKGLPSLRERLWVFFTFYDSSFEYYANTGQFEKGIAFAEKHIPEINKYSHMLDSMQSIILSFFIAKLYFGTGRYNHSIEWMNKIRQKEQELWVRPGLEVNIKLFYIIVHYEKGNTDLLSYLSKSLHRHLKVKQRLYKLETVVLDFFGKKIQRANSKKELTEEFRKLKKEILTLSKDAYESVPLKEFDYISWIESKIENRPFAELVRERQR